MNYSIKVIEALPASHQLTNKDLIDGEIVEAAGSRDVYAVTREELVSLNNPQIRFNRSGFTDHWGTFRRFPKGTQITITV